MDKEYLTAQERITDLTIRKNKAIGSNALEFMDSYLTEKEIADSNLRVQLISELIKARHEKGITQKKLEELSVVKQPVIARMEKGITSPRIDTFLKILAPLGKTLAIVPLKPAK